MAMHQANGRALRIGELATQAGVSIDTLRYYERVGLLSRAPRTAGGFRLYQPDTLGRVRFVKQAQRLGLSLTEIKELVRPAHRSARTRCESVHAVIVKRLAQVDSQLRELEAFRQTLRLALEECASTLAKAQVTACPVVESLSTEVGQDAVAR